ncbi:hypothetical protein [Flavobacterium davisii]|uniref:Uncharacterized protein n=1 Tax=Flavobacterium columnare TaxID=996 RepID=A0A8G0KV61_9FLAO|nr:hypothetical protein [Flavobacterium davisii]QYS89608.1 hypothetical protein JJC05_04915 [Flavobacterium davisii]
MVNFLVITTVPVIETPKGVALNDGTKAVDISPATVRVPNKDGWIQIKDHGTLPCYFRNTFRKKCSL